MLCGLLFVLLYVSGCVKQGAAPEVSAISGRVVLAEDPARGLADVSLVIVDETSSLIQTDREGQFEAVAFSHSVIVPRKTGYRFVPEKQVVGEDREFVFTAYPWAEPDFTKWGMQFLFASHRDRVEAVAFTADDQYIASAGNDRTIRIWRAADGQLIRTMSGHTSAVKVIAFSPDGQYLASGGRDGKIIIWDWQTGLEIKTLPGHTDLVSGLAWSPDGTKLASSSWDRVVRIWDFAAGTELVAFRHESWVRAVAWSSDGEFLLSAGDDVSLKVWHVERGELITEFEIGDKIMSLVVAPHGSLAAVWLASGALRVIDYETGEDTFLQRYPSEFTALSWSSDGAYLAAGIGRMIHIWAWPERDLVQVINAENEVLALAWGSQSYLLVGGSHRGIIQLWSAASGQNVLRIAGHTGPVLALAWSPQGDYLASGGDDGMVRIWDLQERTERLRLRPAHSGPVQYLAWSPDGTYLASGGHDFLLRVWNVPADEYVGAFTERITKPFVHREGFEFAVGLKNVSHEDMVLSVSWAPNGKKIATASWDKTVAIWDAATRAQRVKMENPQGWITTVAWSPHGDEVAFGGYDQLVHIHSAATGEELTTLQGHTGWVQCVAWSPDGRYLASSGYDGMVLIWDREAGQIVRRLAGDEHVVMVVEWSPCGRFLAGGSYDGTVRIWNAGTGETLYTYPGRVLGLQSLAWSPKGDQLAITEYNSVIILGELD